MADIEENLHISRSHMIAVGLLIGCDYSPKGVPGVGKAQVLKVCAELSTDQILERLVSSFFVGYWKLNTASQIFM